VPDLSWVAGASALRIERGRSGRDAAWVVHYDLTRREERYWGMAVLTATRIATPGAPRTARQFRSGAIELDVPATVVGTFLQALAKASPRSTPLSSAPAGNAADEHPWWRIDIVAATDCIAPGCEPPRTLRLSSPRLETRPSPWYLWSSERAVELEPGPLSEACDALVSHLRDEALRAQIR
jgi:hypothetical protein